MNLVDLVIQQSEPDTKETVYERRNLGVRDYGDKTYINGYDFDGVITAGLRPSEGDVIITGRSYCMAKETFAELKKLGIECPVYFNPSHRSECSREDSGAWKAEMISRLPIKRFYEDDPIQASFITNKNPNVEIIYIISKVFPKK